VTEEWHLDGGGLVVRPGDALIVRVSPDRASSQEDVDVVRAALAEKLPGVKVIIIAADQLAAVRLPAEPEKPT
jgi:hypothetical protein